MENVERKRKEEMSTFQRTSTSTPRIFFVVHRIEVMRDASLPDICFEEISLHFTSHASFGQFELQCESKRREACEEHVK